MAKVDGMSVQISLELKKMPGGGWLRGMTVNDCYGLLETGKNTTEQVEDISSKYRTTRPQVSLVSSCSPFFHIPNNPG